jgi:hypothetical protein
VNPVHAPVIDLPGRRYRASGFVDYAIAIEAAFLF